MWKSAAAGVGGGGGGGGEVDGLLRHALPEPSKPQTMQPVNMEGEPKVRTEFPETWIWADAVSE